MFGHWSCAHTPWPPWPPLMSSPERPAVRFLQDVFTCLVSHVSIFTHEPYYILYLEQYAWVNSQWPKSIYAISCYIVFQKFSEEDTTRWWYKAHCNKVDQVKMSHHLDKREREREVNPGDGSLPRKPCHCQCRCSAWQISGQPCIIFRWSFALSTAFILRATQCQPHFEANITRSTRRKYIIYPWVAGGSLTLGWIGSKKMTHSPDGRERLLQLKRV